MESFETPGATPPLQEGFAPPPTPPTPPTPPVTPEPAPAGQFAGGGSVGSWLNGVSLTDVMTVALVGTALGMIIYYYRARIIKMKQEDLAVQKDIEELKTNLQTVMGPNYQKMS